MSATPQARPVDGRAFPTRARGARPTYFDDDGATDAVIAIVTALAAEVWTLRERLDTLEALLERSGQAQPGEVDAYEPDAARAERREREASAFTGRVFRVFEEMREEIVAGDGRDDYLDVVRRAFDEI